jgi:hypothetical protein
MLFTQKTKTIPTDLYSVNEDFDREGALAFSRDQAPPAYLAVMLELQDSISDIRTLVATMATAKEPGYLAHAAGQLNALQELWDALETRREAAAKVV